MQKNDEAGFTLLSVLIAVMIIGVMTAIAVPRLSAMMTRANTARIQSDLTTIDTSTEKGTNPKSLSDLTEYLQDADKLKPPAGKCYMRGKADPQPVPEGTTYAIGEGTTKTGEVRATCLEHTANDFVHDTTSQTN